MNERPLYYISDNVISKYIEVKGIDFLLDAAREALYAHYSAAIQQPVKQYLTLSGNNPFKRIISMPIVSLNNSFMHGIKWISSNPENIDWGGERANSIIILNDSKTLIPTALIEGNSISSYRTLANTILVIQQLNPNIKSIGILGLGKLGMLHVEYLPKVFPSIEKIHYFSKSRSIEQTVLGKNCVPENNFRDVILKSDIIITTTTPQEPYIKSEDIVGLTDKILMNISLADYTKDVYHICDTILVDDILQCTNSNKVFRMAWDENKALKNITLEFSKLIYDTKLSQKMFKGITMVNLIGMAVEDIVLANNLFNSMEISDLIRLR